MGAEFNVTHVKCTKKALAKTFDALVEECAYNSGHGGYTGTFAEKDCFQVIPPPKGQKYWTDEEAEKHAQDDNDKWGPASVYQTGKDLWMVAGWCSS